MNIEEKAMFLRLVTGYVAEDQSLVVDIHQAILAGIKQRLEREINARNQAETALASLNHAAIQKIDKKYIPLVASAIVNSLAYGGTPYAEQFKKYME